MSLTAREAIQFASIVLVLVKAGTTAPASQVAAIRRVRQDVAAAFAAISYQPPVQ